MLKQVVYDQKAARVQGDTLFLNALVVESQFVGQGMTEILPNLERIICAALGPKRVMSLGGVLLLTKCAQAMDGFILGKD